MSICTYVLVRPYSSDSYKAVSVFHAIKNVRVSVTGFYISSSSPLFLSTLPFPSLFLSHSFLSSLCLP
ncbi:unnamed protein product [Hymenolepis diminuta]|uniref:Uncharacterized protein n=1 Tax=Hymenolepis diminuta TaxID=6216 RepID=A0A564ZE90_HYMDI|nr:unnamed protein product [Hymenolepis diminuta]